MKHFLKIKYPALIILALLIVFTTCPVMAAGPYVISKGDWYGETTGSGVAHTKLDTSGDSVYIIAFARDSNNQAVLKYLDATAQEFEDDLEIYGVTDYTVLSSDYSGGTSTQMTVDNASGFDSASSHGAVSFFAIDDGGGNIGVGEIADGSQLSGTALLVTAGCSTFAEGTIAGIHDLSGVTFAKGSRVYPLVKAGQIRVGSSNNGAGPDNVTIDNDTIYTAPVGDPLILIMVGHSALSGDSPFNLSGTVEYR